MSRRIRFVVCLLALAVMATAQGPNDPNEGQRMNRDVTTGLLSLSWWGRSGRNYFIQQSDDLLSGWNYLPTMAAGNNNPIQYGLSVSSSKGFFRLQFDSDLNGLPDAWEVTYFGAAGQNPSALSAAGDGYTLLQEFQLNRNPNDYYQGMAPQVAIIGGNGQTGPAGTFLAQPLEIKVSDSAGIAYANAPVTFTVSSGGGGIAVLSSGPTQSTIATRTDAAGQLEVYFQVPATASGANTITVQAGTAAPLSFTENATPGNAPQVQLAVSPTSANAPAAPTLTATIASGVANQVVFYEGQQVLGTVAAAPYTLALSNVTAGVHSYTAVATNTATGATGQGTVAFSSAVPEQPFAQYRYDRGTGTTDFSFDTFILALSQTQGVPLAYTGNSGFAPGALPWFLRTANTLAYHVSVQITPVSGFTDHSATYPAAQALQNPVVAFGAAGGGTPLYTNQSYAFGVASGGQTAANPNDLRIRVFAKSTLTLGATNVVPVATFMFPLPRKGTADWTTFAQQGFQRTYALTSGATTYPLVTALQYQPSQTTAAFGTHEDEGSSPFILTHTDTSPGTPAYYYAIDYLGVGYAQTVTVNGNTTTLGGQEVWMAMASPSTTGNQFSPANSSGVYVPCYTLDFTQRPQQVSTLVSEPQFQGRPVPPAYAGLSEQELLNLSNPVIYQFTNPTAAAALTAVNNSPELEVHPVLDKLVADLSGNPLTIANYVLNNIQLTDALSYNRNGIATEVSLNCGGVNRGAMATYMEQQGNPTEQCALLIYLLRKAGVPCGYVFPANDTLQMLDARMSSILRMQLHNAVDLNGNLIMPQVIPVNYPWVAAYVGGTNAGGNYSGGTWVHIFPWMKDTAITEGYDLGPLLPGPGSGTPTANAIGYQTGFAWMRNYIQRDPNIMSLSTQWDDPAHLFVPFVKAQLAAYHPTIGLKDIGITAFDRQNIYASWSQFPQPWGLTGTLSSANFQPTLTQLDVTDQALSPPVGSIFNSVTLTVQTLGNGGAAPTPVFSPASVTVNALELHNRRLMVQETQNGTGSTYTMKLSLAPFQYGVSGTIGQFTAGSDLTAKQVLTNTNVPVSNTVFYIQATFTRNRNLPNGFVPPPSAWGQFLGVADTLSAQFRNYFYSGDLVTLCLDYGRVSQPMLDLHAQNYWTAQQAVLSGSGGSVDADDLLGEPVYLMGCSYYKASDDFRAQVLALYKTSWISNMWVGTAKIGAARTSQGALPGGVITLRYPNFDVVENNVAVAAYRSAKADSGVPFPQDAAILNAVGTSANEHAVINTFFGLTDSASTVHVLHKAQQAYLGSTGQAPPFLTPENYAGIGSTSYTATVNGVSVSRPLSTWAGGLWSTITSYMGGSPYAFAWLTPGDVTCANGAYTGMGYFIGDGKGSVSTLLAGNQQLGLSNGGSGAALPSPYSITTATSGATSPAAWPLTFNGAAYSLGDLAPTIGAPLTYFLGGSPATFSLSTADAAIAGGTYTISTDMLGMNHLAGIAYGNSAAGSAPPTTNAALASEAQAAQSKGYLPTMVHGARFTGKTVADPVDVIEGGFHVDENDLSVPGPLPIQLQRHYYSLNQADNEFGQGWTVNYEPYLVVSNNSPPVIYAAEMDGSVLAYTQKSGSTTTWIPQAAGNPSLLNQNGEQAGGLTNLFNNVLTVAGGTYTLTGADGSVRTYVTSQYPVGTGTYLVTRSRPYLTTWRDAQGNTLTFTIGATNTVNDYGKLSRITSSNGNYLQLDYDRFGHIITAWAGDGRKCSYGYDNYGDLISVTRPDGSVVGYAYDHQQQTVNSVAQTFSDHLLTQENKPDGRRLVNTYYAYPDRRVYSQQATVGPNGTLATNATFTYSNTTANGTITGSTTVADAYSRVTTYTYSTSQITQILDPAPLSTSISQVWYQSTNAATGAYNRALQQQTDKRGLVQNFLYDASGNRKQTNTVGDLTGSGAAVTQTTTALYNAQNLPTSVTDTSTGNTTTFEYTSSISLYLPTKVTTSTPGGTVSQTVYGYGNVSGGTAKGVLLQTTQALNTSDVSVTDYTYTAQGYVATQTRHTGTFDPDVTYTFGYNAAGNLTLATDAAQRSTSLSYNAMGRVISTEVRDQLGNLLSFRSNFYNQNGELEWTQGPRLNPDDYTYRQYDGAGRLAQFLQYRSEARADGSGVQQATGDGMIATTSTQYDLFGNLTLTMDPKGNTVQTPHASYDAIGRVLNRIYADSTNAVLATEAFTYEPGDKTATHTNALGGVTQYFYTQTGRLKKQIDPDQTTTQWRYQLDGRLSEEDFPNGTKRFLAYDDFNRVITSTLKDSASNVLATEAQTFDRRGNPISATDADGFTTVTTYDRLNRVKVVTGPPAGQGSARRQVTHTYDAAGMVETAVNAAGESTVTTFDALRRPVQVVMSGATGPVVRRKALSYAPDHHSVTSMEGTATNVTTSYTDIQGQPVLVRQADGGKVVSQYDVNGNPTVSTDALGRTTTYQYDGLNRLAVQKLPDTAQTSYTYDLVNRVLTRTMPEGLVWSANLDTSARKVSERLMQGANTTRAYGYAYNTSGPNMGRLDMVTDARSIVSTYGYDAFGRVSSVAAVDPSAAQLGVTQGYGYNRRGLLTELDQSYQNAALSPPTAVVRGYDGAGALASEQVYVNGTPATGTLKDTWQQSHDAAGRRSGLMELNYPAEPFTYSHRADGALTGTGFRGNGLAYGYGLDGLLTGRTTPFSTQTINTRDVVGRITREQQTVGSTVVLDETGIGWRADATQTTYTANRTGSGAVSETRAYGYDDTAAPNQGRGHLTSETFAPGAGTSAALTYQFDNNTPGGLGKRTNATLSGALSGANASTYGTYARLAQQTMTGSLLGAAGAPVNDTFYDAAGQLTNHNPGSNSDVLTWDALGRLVGMQRNAGGNGWVWTAVYDGFGRRLQTTQQSTAAGALTGTPLVIKSSYDPEVEFMEVAVTVGAQRAWLVHGPDANGSYGGLQGTGGVEAVVNEATGTATGVLSDIYGHTEATVTGTVVSWNAVRSTGYGPEPGTVAPPLDGLRDLATYLAWHGKYIDGTGFYHLGTRYYDPTSGTFPSCDPLGHDASMSLYDYCGGDPVNGFDPDGRFGKSLANQAWSGIKSAAAFFGSGMAQAQAAQNMGSPALLLNPDLASANQQVFDQSRQYQQMQIAQMQQNYQVNLDMFDRSRLMALDATLNPAYHAMVGFTEANTGFGLQPNNLGQQLSYQQRIDSAAGGTLATIDTILIADGIAKTGLSFINTAAAAKGVESISPLALRFSQSSVNDVEEIAASMRANGWQGAPIDVVRMGDGALTTFDNTRVLAAHRAGINVQAVIREAGEAFPAGRWTPKSGIQPTTWEQAVQMRIQQQNRLFRQTYPNGSSVTGSAQ